MPTSTSHGHSNARAEERAAHPHVPQEPVQHDTPKHAFGRNIDPELPPPPIVPERKPVAEVPEPEDESASRSSKIRIWAREKGLQVSDRGAISQSIVAAYDQQNPEVHEANPW